MSDKEIFEGIKRKLVDGNEKLYGKEIREKYGNEAIDASNAKLMGLTPEQFKRTRELSQQINETLKKAYAQGDPSGPLAQEVCAMHKEWLMFYWSSYSREAHLGLAQTYVDDPRFKKYYDDIVEGGAVFLRDSLMIFCA